MNTLTRVLIIVFAGLIAAGWFILNLFWLINHIVTLVHTGFSTDPIFWGVLNVIAMVTASFIFYGGLFAALAPDDAR